MARLKCSVIIILLCTVFLLIGVNLCFAKKTISTQEIYKKLLFANNEWNSVYGKACKTNSPVYQFIDLNGDGKKDTIEFKTLPYEEGRLRIKFTNGPNWDYAEHLVKNERFLIADFLPDQKGKEILFIKPGFMKFNQREYEAVKKHMVLPKKERMKGFFTFENGERNIAPNENGPCSILFDMYFVYKKSYTLTCDFATGKMYFIDCPLDYFFKDAAKQIHEFYYEEHHH